MRKGRLGRLDGKVALVTGAASGLGRAIAVAFAREGARVAGTDIDRDGLRETAELCEQSILTLEQDVTDANRWAEVIAEVEAAFGALHILVNNAGIGVLGSIESTSDEDWRRVHAVDLDSVYYGCRAALPAMRRAGAGAIVNISSIAGIVADGNLAAYCSAKAAVRHLTKSVALHCARKGDPIRCNSVHPAFIDTPMLSAAMPHMPREELLRQLARGNPMGRLGDPEDVALAALYLASDEAKFVTGAELVVDGGLSAQ
ncbi:MAG: glucose 1-dehydrogenase [Alphaproteobacteria bacterium]|nr:MAG: glucose 1-dehydrogenase [Alphaproteobacteria bacterium]